MKFLIINGPNLNLLGQREPELYGDMDFPSFLTVLREKFIAHKIDYFQSNVEGEIISAIQEADNNYDGIVLNAAAYSHTSIGIADAVTAINTPVIEVHITNIFRRENFRHFSYLTSRCIGAISGLGLKGYELAVRYFLEME